MFLSKLQEVLYAPSACRPLSHLTPATDPFITIGVERDTELSNQVTVREGPPLRESCTIDGNLPEVSRDLLSDQVTQKLPEESDILMALSQPETRVSTEVEQTLELLRDPSTPAAIQRRYDWRNPIVEGTEYVVRSVDGIESIRFIPQFEQGSAHHAITLGREIRIEPLPAFRDNAERITDQFKVYGMSEVERPKGNLNEIYISTLIHEVTHREGGGEFLAFKAQFDYLLQSGAFKGNPTESTLRAISLYPPESLAKSALEARAEGLSIEQLAPFLPGGESFRELRSTFRERRGEEPNPARDSGLGSFEASFYENLAVYFQSEAISAIPRDDPDYDQKIDAAMDIGDREAALFRRAVLRAQKRE